jgi:3-hydroxyacyl-CoA dehydrogenase/enoyl-CoA hydratase/3-hydroxybutyryl-CoA epimerase
MTAPILYSKDADNIVTLTFNSEGQRVNTLNDEMRDCLIATIERVVREKDSIAGVIFASAKSTFFAGGDLNDLYQLKAEDAGQLFDQITTVKRAFRYLETLGKPVVAAINGSAVGGGFELALACHYRVCINDPKTQLGLPEASLGLLPGLGGVVRMNLLLGLIGSQSYLQEGQLFNPAHGFDAGMVDQLVTDSTALMQAARTWILSGSAAVQPWDRVDYQVPGGRPGTPELDAWTTTAMDTLRAKTHGCYPAPEVILRCSIAGMKVEFDQADLIETRGFIELVTGAVAKNLIGTFWFALNSLKAGAGRPKDIATKRFSRIVLLGSGVMRDALSALFASRRLETVVKTGSMETLGDLDVADAQMIIALDSASPVLKARMLKARTTSATAESAGVIGFHFFSAVQRMPIVEIVVYRQTSLETLAHAIDFVLQIGKTPIVVRDSPGLLTLRLNAAFVREGKALLDEGLDISAIDAGALAAGFALGPLASEDQAAQDPAAISPANHVPLQDVKDRLLFCMALESVRILQEGIVNDVRDGNIGSVMGAGYPRWTGGVFQFLNQYGLSKAVERAQVLATMYGERFDPPKLLIEQANRKKLFS